VIDFRYHLVSIVAVFLALAIGIVLGSTELQGATIDGLRRTQDSLSNQLNKDNNQLSDNQAQLNADQKFYAAAEPKLLAQNLAGDRIVILAEPGAPNSVINGIKQAAAYAGATITLTVSLQPQFNDLSGATFSRLQALNAQLASTDDTVLGEPADAPTVNQTQAAQLIAGAVLQKQGTAFGLTAAQATNVLGEYAQAGYLTTDPTPTATAMTDPASLAVIVTPGSAPTDGPDDPANQVLLGVAQEFATYSAATVVAGSVTGSSPADSAMSVLRSSSVSSQVSSIDNADTTLGQISTIWALADQLAGGTPNSYGVSGASAVSPTPAAAPTDTPTPTTTPSTTPSTKTSGKATTNK
jgi:Copper transport outer membrane protein, MctB